MDGEQGIWRQVIVGLGLLALAGLARAAGAPSVFTQTWASTESPYVKETLLYTVRVYSRVDLETIEVIPPVVAGTAVEPVDEDLITGTAFLSGAQYVTSDTRYLVTPMRAGSLRLAGARVKYVRKGQRGWSGGDSQVLTTDPVTVEVRSGALPGGDWRPLQWLEVKAHWREARERQAGEPLSLALDIRARGTRGDLLPSLERQLGQAGFKVYSEHPEVETRITEGGYVWGRRVERYTLVPVQEGAFDIPELTVPWWDINTATAKVATVPARRVVVGEGGRVVDAASSGSAAATSWMLSPLALLAVAGLLAAFFLGWILGTGEDARRPLRRMLTAVTAWTGRALFGLLRTVMAALPRQLAGRVRDLSQRWGGALGQRLERFLPRRVKVWWCVRCLDAAPDAKSLCRVLRRIACRDLRMSPNAPLTAIAGRLDAAGPRRVGPPLGQLLREVDDALYHGSPLKIRYWKRSFRRGFRQAMLVAQGGGTARAEQRGLPELNP